MTDADLEQLFSQHGTVQSVQIIIDRDTGRSKGFGFVEMGSGDEGQAAIAALHDKDIGGRKLLRGLNLFGFVVVQDVAVKSAFHVSNIFTAS